MIKSTITTHICDGCGVEEKQPFGWYSLRAVQLMGAFFHTSIDHSSEDYCVSCVSKMRQSVKNLVIPSQLSAASEQGRKE